MTKRRKTIIASIFGQIESVVADAMVAEGKVTKIDAGLLAPTVLFDDLGRRAYCALVFSPETSQEFDRRVRELRQ